MTTTPVPGQPPPTGVRLLAVDEHAEARVAFVTEAGGAVGLGGVVDDLGRRARRTWAPGRAVHRAMTWERHDRHDPAWWPQGITTSADADDSESVLGRRLVVVAWYAKDLGDGRGGSRVTVLDIDRRRYQHVLLVAPRLVDGKVRLEPLRVHAGGLVWRGDWLHVAATGRGLVCCRFDDVVRVAAPVDGHDYVLPVGLELRAATGEGTERLRYSFASLDRSTTPPSLLVGEYGRRQQTKRLARFALGADGLPVVGADAHAHPELVADAGLSGMQGAVTAGGTTYVTVSHGTRTPGSVHVGEPGAWREHRWATPVGPEDVTWWPSTDLLWSVTEHPGRRWVYSMKRSRMPG